MTTKSDVLDIVADFINFRETRVSDRVNEIRNVRDPKLKIVYAKESLEELVGNTKEYNDNVEEKVGEAFAAVMKECLKEIEKIASGGDANISKLADLEE